jgi:hypothetical protein
MFKAISPFPLFFLIYVCLFSFFIHSFVVRFCCLKHICLFVLVFVLLAEVDFNVAFFLGLTLAWAFSLLVAFGFCFWICLQPLPSCLLPLFLLAQLLLLHLLPLVQWLNLVQ